MTAEMLPPCPVCGCAGHPETECPLCGCLPPGNPEAAPCACEDRETTIGGNTRCKGCGEVYAARLPAWVGAVGERCENAETLPSCPLCGEDPVINDDGFAICPNVNCELAGTRQRRNLWPEDWRRLAGPRVPETVRAVLAALVAFDEPIIDTDPKTARGRMMQINQREGQWNRAVQAWIAAGRPGL